MTTIRIFNQCEKWRDPDDVNVAAITKACVEQVHDVAKAWGEHVPRLTDAVADSGWHIVLLDNPDQANALGYHDVAPDGRPYARVFVDPVMSNGGTWLQGALSVSAVVSHELCEMLGDPAANRWADDWQGTAWALELCDATESDAYETRDGVSVSNFLFPSYFNPLGRAPFDQRSLVTAPFEVRPGGYAIFMNDGDVSQTFGHDYPEWKLALKDADGSRTNVRTR